MKARRQQQSQFPGSARSAEADEWCVGAGSQLLHCGSVPTHGTSAMSTSSASGLS